MRDRAAHMRSGLTQGSPEQASQRDPRIWVDAKHLRSLENRARALRFLPRQPAGSVLNGRHASRLRGRGLNFEELRGYLPGDDPRTIDWKVTARTGKAHVRIFSEERDRPAILIVDQRMSMFFGTKLNMKSVTAAEAAALTAFRVLDQGDRIGGIVFGDDYVAEIKPRRGSTTRDQFLQSLVRANNDLRADRQQPETPMLLNEPIAMVARSARKNNLVVVFSDFDGIDDHTGRLVGTIARQNDVVLCPVTDPISKEIPEGLKLIVSDGELQVKIDTSNKDIHKGLTHFATGRLAEVLEWQRKFGLAILPLSAGEDTVSQIRNLTGLGPRRNGGRHG